VAPLGPWYARPAGGADALLKARATARKRDDADDARELAEELRRLGVTVRDEKKRQYWRPSPRRA